jgi:hypothetical protein
VQPALKYKRNNLSLQKLKNLKKKEKESPRPRVKKKTEKMIY